MLLQSLFRVLLLHRYGLLGLAACVPCGFIRCFLCLTQVLLLLLLHRYGLLGLDLSRNFLEGPLPAELGELTKLELILLAANSECADTRNVCVCMWGAGCGVLWGADKTSCSSSC
jgi:hypothetical protein